MNGQHATNGIGGLWGYCSTCERWRYDAWGSGAAPACDRCGTAPNPVEERNGGVTRLRLLLDMPPGAEFPVLP